jgi:arylsulfatase A-like enzyme
MERAVKAGKPFFVWHNSTRMHVWTRLGPKYENSTGYGLYADGMKQLDDIVGELLAKLEELGVADNTIVVFSTDNGPEKFTWPDGGESPFRGEKGGTWEGGFRVPSVVRWPGVVKPGTVINGLFSLEDWAVTLLAAAGEPDVKEKLKQGHVVNGRTFKVHLDGYDQRDLLAGKGPDKRREFFYWTDDGNLAGLRFDQYKVVFMEQAAHGLEVWMQPLVPLRAPKIFNLRSDPFERAEHEAGGYDKWFVEHAFVLVPAQAIVGQHLATFQEFPPRQKPGSFSVDQAMDLMMKQKNNN